VVPPASADLLAANAKSSAGSGITMTVVQIVNNVAGAGILTLGAGMAAGVGWVPAVLICMLVGALSGFTFYLIGAACDLTGETSFKGLWSRTLGKDSTWLVDGSITLVCLSAAIIYSGILGDVTTSLLSLAGVATSAATRKIAICALTLAVLMPLSLLKDLSALAFTSAIGCGAILYTALFVAIRAFDGSYCGGLASPFVQSLPVHLRPTFKQAWSSTAGLLRLDAKSLVLISNLGLAFIAHYNAPAFYSGMADATPERFAVAVSIAFSILTVLYTLMMGLAYATFGSNTASNLLHNYAEADVLAVLGRVATGASILFGFPLAMLGLRSSLADMCGGLSAKISRRDSLLRRSLASVASPSARVPLVLSLLALITFVACTLTDIGVIVGVSGALLGSAVVYIFPALIYADVASASSVYAVVPLGAFFGILGTYMTLAGN
jgi:sodium-coupled neutral amino acid transporter 11